MKIESKALRQIMADIVKLSAKRTPLPILNHMLLKAEGGRLTVAGTDLDIWIERSIECGKTSIPALCVNAKRLWSCVDGAGEKVDISYNQKSKRLSVASDGWSQELSTLEADEFPKSPVVGGKPIGINFGDLAAGIKAVAWCASDVGDSAPWTRTVKVEGTAKALRCFASDRKSIAEFNRASICGDVNFVLPAAAADVVSNALLTEGSEMTLSDKRITVRSDSAIVSAVLMDASWPNVSGYTGAKVVKCGKVDKEAMRAACKRLGGLFPEGFAPVKMTATKNELTMTAKTPTDSGEELLEIEGGQKHGIDFDCLRAAEALGHFEDGKVQLGVTENTILLEQGDCRVFIAKVTTK